jgi:TatD DNase family protein
MPSWKPLQCRYIDSHCHLDALEFEADLDQVRENARSMGVDVCLIPSVNRASFERVRDLANRLQDVYALGIHPMYTNEAELSDLDALREIVAHCLGLSHTQRDSRFVAIGEIGLDRAVKHLQWDKQWYFYEQQLHIAAQFDLPVVVHVRQSVDFVLKGLRKTNVRSGIAHAFNGSLQQAQQLIEMGFKLGFGGAMTYPRALHLRELVKVLPLESIVLETDAPDIVPAWIYVTAQARSTGLIQSRNDPAQIVQIAQEISKIRDISVPELMYATTENFLSLFAR